MVVHRTVLPFCLLSIFKEYGNILDCEFVFVHEQLLQFLTNKFESCKYKMLAIFIFREYLIRILITGRFLLPLVS